MGILPSSSVGLGASLEEKFMAGTKSWLDNFETAHVLGLSGNSAIDAYSDIIYIKFICNIL